MRVLFLAFEFCTFEPWEASLHSLGRHDVRTHFYTRETPCDHGCLDAADQFRPDLILFTGMADWDKTPSLSTFKRLRRYAPVVHLSGDLSDPPYDPYLKRYGEDGTFDLSVNIDGNDAWDRHGARGITLLSPTAPQFYVDPPPLDRRPIDFGFAGGCGSPSRLAIVTYLQEKAGLVVKQYDRRWGSYADYARFLMDCKIALNIPFSGSDAVRQVKGRVLEAGLAGCVLLDHVESKSFDWFPSGIFAYSCKEHAADIVGEMAASHMKLPARDLSRRVREEHAPEIFWRRIFKEVFG